MAKHFHTALHSREGRVILDLAGNIDGSSAAQVCYEIEMLGLQECSLDFSRVKAIDLFAARVLARGLRGLRNRGVRFQVEGLPEPVARTLCLGGALDALR